MHFRPRCVVWIVYAFRLGKSHVNGYFICVGLRGKILRSVVGAVPVCPPASPHKGASIVTPAQCVCVFGMETSLRERSGGHTGTAPTVSFGWIACGWLMSFGQVARGMGDFVWVVLFVCWLVKTVHMNQHHRCYTFDSPGLPTIGGYPG